MNLRQRLAKLLAVDHGELATQYLRLETAVEQDMRARDTASSRQAQTRHGLVATLKQGKELTK
jgi:hypothetical protein